KADALATFAAAVTHARAAHSHRTDAGHDLTLGQMPVAHQPPPAIIGKLVGMAAEQARNLGLNRLRQKRPRPVAQNLGQQIGKSSWLRELQNISLSHGVSLLCWRSGGVEHLHDTPPYPFTPSPTFAHSSGLSDVLFMQQIIRKANHGALKDPLFRCVIVSVRAFCHWSERTPLGPSLWCKLSGGLHHAEDSNCAGCILGDAERCRCCRPASQGAAASGACSGWQVSGRQGSDWQISTSSARARRDQGLTVCSLTLERLSGLDTPITTLYAPLRRGISC